MRHTMYISICKLPYFFTEIEPCHLHPSIIVIIIATIAKIAEKMPKIRIFPCAHFSQKNYR